MKRYFAVMPLALCVVFFCTADAEAMRHKKDESALNSGKRVVLEVNKKAVELVNFKVGSPYFTPMLAEELAPDSVTIEGEAQASQAQMVEYIKRRNLKPKLNCTVEEIVSYYYEEAGREGIRADVALCQALKETGFFAYGGDVLPSQNNFCGLGATGNKVKGAVFKTPQEGVRAHIQHLLVYTTVKLPSTTIIDPRYNHVKLNRKDVYGKIKRWTGLNGVWAVPGTRYGQDILRMWREAKAPDGSDAALSTADALVGHSPDESTVYIFRGIVNFERGEYSKAEKDFSSAIKLNKSAPEAYYNRGILKEQSGDLKGARKDYESALFVEPKFTNGWYNLGLIQLQMKDYDKAKESFKKVLNLHPQNAEAQNAIGVAEIKLGDYKAAKLDFEKAINIQTTNENARDNLIILEACTMDMSKSNKK